MTTTSLQALFQNFYLLLRTLHAILVNTTIFYPFSFFTIVESKCFPLNPCKHGGVCHEDDTSYKCTCATGWTGISCESKAEISRVNNICYLYSTYIQNVLQTVVTVVLL